MRVVFLVVFAAMSFLAEAGSLADFRWEKRVLVWQAGDDDFGRAFGEVWRADDPEVIERDLVLVRVDSAEVRDQLGLAAGSNAVLLIGKDGGVKARWTEVLPAADVFALIDAMPMRQDEMRAKE